MKKNKNFKQYAVIATLLLAVFATGCKDQVVGIEGHCPEVVTTFPADSAINVVLDVVITVTFSDEMNPATINASSFVLIENITKSAKDSSEKEDEDKQQTGISGVVTYNENTNTMTFTPDAPLISGTIYQARVKTSVQDPIGNAMLEDYVWSFSTGEAPLVVSTNPEHDAVNVALDHIISATFTIPMDATTFDFESFTLMDDTSTPVTGIVSYSNFNASFEPNTLLNPGTTYTATITTEAESAFGIPLSEDFVWTFTTASAPLVLSTDPIDGATNVALNKILSATFDLQMDATTLNETTFTLVDNMSAPITGTVSYSNFMASFEPDTILSPETTYTASISTEATSDLGVALSQDVVWTFSTGSAPMVVLTDPLDEAMNVDFNKIITATFNTEMNPSTLNQNSFTLVDGGSNPISGTVSYTNMMASFEPDALLSPQTTYTATISTAAQDQMGIGLSEDFVWTFSTGQQQGSGFLGAAETYGLMATSAITNIGNTIINGDVSLDPGTSLTGFPPGIINGTLNINNTESAMARADLLVAYNYYKALPPGTTIAPGADLGALYPNGIPAGTYTSGSTMLVGTTLVLDAQGDVDAVWVFQIGSSLTTGADVVLTNGANENNVFWVPTEDATIGVSTEFNGTIVAGRDVTAVTGAVINGRILAGAINAGTIALDGNIINVPGF